MTQSFVYYNDGHAFACTARKGSPAHVCDCAGRDPARVRSVAEGAAEPGTESGGLIHGQALGGSKPRFRHADQIGSGGKLPLSGASHTGVDGGFEKATAIHSSHQVRHQGCIHLVAALVSSSSALLGFLVRQTRQSPHKT